MKDNLKQKELGHASSGKALCKQALGPDPQDPELKKKNTQKKTLYVCFCVWCVCAMIILTETLKYKFSKKK
jgi:hypothetical protein